MTTQNVMVKNVYDMLEGGIGFATNGLKAAAKTGLVGVVLGATLASFINADNKPEFANAVRNVFLAGIGIIGTSAGCEYDNSESNIIYSIRDNILDVIDYARDLYHTVGGVDKNGIY